MDESKLIFIISQPRAGSTLLQKLISNNEKVDTVSEPWLLLSVINVLRPDLIEAKFNFEVAITGFNDYLDKKNARAELKSGLKKLVLDLYKVSSDDLYFVDKTPRYYEIIPQIRELLPQAKFVVLKRNPFASLHSMMTTWAGSKLNWPEMDRFYRDFMVAPRLIQTFCEESVSDPNVWQLKYEELVKDPAGVLKPLYEWLHIPFDNGVLDLSRNDKTKGRFGDDAYKAKPLNDVSADSADSWKSVTGDKEMSSFFHGYQKYLTPDFLRRYGYQSADFPETKGLFGTNRFELYLNDLKQRKKI